MPQATFPRIVYMGTPDFAVEPLKEILESGYNVSAVVTVPDKPAGRGLKFKPSPVKTFAQEKNLPILQPSKLKDPDFINELKKINPDIIVVVAFRMLPKEVWQLPKIGTFNLHASLLPQYRGAAPINWAIINGETQTGVTTFLLDEQIDTGNILLQEVVPISEDESAGELHDKLMLVGSKLVVETINLLAKGDYKPIPQSQISVEGEIKSAPKIFKETCKIDWDSPVSKIYNHIRGLSPYPAAWSELKIKKGDVESTTSIKIYSAEKTNFHPSAKPGTIATDHKSFINVNCSDGVLSLKRIQVAGKKAMNVDEFLRGLNNTELIEML
ncbi:methionyl-tRNA formyltransferase [Tenuifilum thalassicum]|uniref:Methionyl-tRNA formyltransferase n=1 Tax=Tenuifilum thalassicum TaxID=2590900 RepID=A0A7D3Y0L8_9BACT|nr:methionyl-tRNA formyltransferase [Tenuifilum thalassicum]QKG80573.1 methionyl-tRNA formyltransferase [Tenuifilum thalassicum]